MQSNNSFSFFKVFNGKISKKIFFTSDTHFGHRGILKYCNRPFKNIEENDRILIENWNKKVPSDGIVFHLGDIGFGDVKKIKEIISRLNGKKYWIVGNHDRKLINKLSDCFEEISFQMNLEIDGQEIILNHYPFLCYAGPYDENGAWQLFGHVHTSPYSDSGFDIPRLKYLFPKQYDVGVDNNNFAPVSFEEICKIMEK